MTEGAGTGGGVLWSAPVIAAFIALIAALVAAGTAAYLARQLKISEFRQAWINDLRKDIAEYMNYCYRWHKFYDAQDAEGLTEKEIEAIRDGIFDNHNEARMLLNRIRMRFNPDEKSKDYQEDEDFLRQLLELLNPGKLEPNQDPLSSWVRLADAAVMQARKILKREWEITKGWRASKR